MRGEEGGEEGGDKETKRPLRCPFRISETYCTTYHYYRFSLLLLILLYSLLYLLYLLYFLDLLLSSLLFNNCEYFYMAICPYAMLALITIDGIKFLVLDGYFSLFEPLVDL